MSDTPSSDLPGDQASFATQAMPPPGSRLSVERFEDGLTVKVAAPGLTGWLLGLFIGGAVCDLLGILSLVAALLKWTVGQGKFDPGELAGAFTFVGVFGSVGLVLTLTSLNMARRQAAIAVTDGLLMALQTGLFGSKQREWQPGEVLAVRVGPSGVEVNNKPVMELQILDAHGRKFSMLAGHREEDLHWLARELSLSLKLPGQFPDEESAEDEDEEDWDSQEQREN